MDDYINNKISTRAVHSGEVRFNEYGSVTTPIVQTSTFIFKNVEEIRKLAEGDIERFEYGRYGHPTQLAAERKLAALEEAEDAILFSSGMSAITTSLFMLLKAGDHLIITDDAYKRTLDFCKSYLGRYNIECTVVRMCDYEAMENAIKPNTRVFFSESPTNPYLNIMDLERLMEIFGKRDITVISDSTFATPFNQKPLEYGV
ncbi:MAG: aminotransferase class I/II-fold pyridoxal phosphate-dependent enzyme, partial [Desulfobacteraceae bacterium]|nr:aminotransferase class I/II-fold pyridoxal phosphate-dependent enzyme [Desulfobacteraceae bacterium]